MKKTASLLLSASLLIAGLSITGSVYADVTTTIVNKTGQNINYTLTKYRPKTTTNAPNPILNGSQAVFTQRVVDNFGAIATLELSIPNQGQCRLSLSTFYGRGGIQSEQVSLESNTLTQYTCKVSHQGNPAEPNAVIILAKKPSIA